MFVYRCDSCGKEKAAESTLRKLPTFDDDGWLSISFIVHADDHGGRFEHARFNVEVCGDCLNDHGPEFLEQCAARSIRKTLVSAFGGEGPGGRPMMAVNTEGPPPR